MKEDSKLDLDEVEAEFKESFRRVQQRKETEDPWNLTAHNSGNLNAERAKSNFNSEAVLLTKIDLDKSDEL